MDVTTDAKMSLAGMLVLFALIAGIVFVATKFDRRALSVLLVGGGLFVFILGFSYIRMASDRHINAVEQEAFLQAKEKTSQVSKRLTNEQMWEHLTSPKISLDGEEKAKPDADEAEATAKKQPRPEWVDKPPTRIGNVYREVIKSGPYSEVAECHRELEDPLREVTMRRLGQLADMRYSPSLERMGIGLDYVLREICRPEWVETVDASVGEMKRVHVLMEFDAAADEQLRTAYRNYERKFRVSQVGGIAGLGLGGLALLYGLLKMDTWTRGYYTKRLFLGVPAVIIGLVLLFIA